MATAFQEISQNPTNIAKYQNNPKIQAVIAKLTAKFGGAGGAEGSPFGGMGGMFGGGASFGGPGGSEDGDSSSSTPGGVPPQPDID